LKVNLRHLDEAFGFPPVDCIVEIEPVPTNWNFSPSNKGVPHTDETKKQISETAKANYTEERKDRIRQSNKTRVRKPLTEETKSRMGSNHKPVMYNHVYYESLTAASDAAGLSKGCFRLRMIRNQINACYV
jgi:hypothetical protein